ncbi:MFS transporter, partial [Sulfuricurvum sp.]|uniref:MFS transporter n=1 Tax=Sulfuricurvum sp. TaxID=2025608 RepID=UPI003BB5CA06
SFMLLKAESNGLALVMIPLAYALYNLTQSLFAIPIGKLADRLGKGTLLSAVYIAFGLGALAMTLGASWAIWVGFGIYGFFAAGFNALAKAIISDTAPMEYKATAYGIYYTSVGIAIFASLVLGGIIWDYYGSNLLFSIASLSAIILGILLYFMRHLLLHS